MIFTLTHADCHVKPQQYATCSDYSYLRSDIEHIKQNLAIPFCKKIIATNATLTLTSKTHHILMTFPDTSDTTTCLDETLLKSCQSYLH